MIVTLWNEECENHVCLCVQERICVYVCKNMHVAVCRWRSERNLQVLVLAAPSCLTQGLLKAASTRLPGPRASESLLSLPCSL